MARTNASGWLATRVAIAAATLVAGGAIMASTSTFVPQVALAEEAAATQEAQQAATTAQISGTFYLDSAQSVVESLQGTRAEDSVLVQTQALDAKAQARAAQCAQDGTHSAQSGDECVTYLAAADAANPVEAVKNMTADWFTEGSALNNTEYGYFGIALFQTQEGDLYLVAVFSNEAGNMGEAGQLVQAVEGSGLQDDGTEVGVPATMTVTVAASDGQNVVDPQNTPSEVQISFDANGGSGDMETLTVPVDQLCGLPAVSFTAPEGMQFKCWNTQADGLGDSYENTEFVTPGTAGMTLYAIWEDVPVTTTTIAFDANGGSGDMETLTVPVDQEYVLPNLSFTAPEGKQFKCWNTDPEGNGDDYDNEGIVTPGAEGMTLYAIWEDVPVTTVKVNFDANGGTGTMDSVDATLNEGYTVPGCSFTAPAGKQFKYWASNREGNAPIYQQDDTFTVTSETTLYAIWEDAPVSQVTISFNANGGTGTMDAVTVDLGSSTTLAKCAYTRSGYVFAGWNTKADGTGSSFADGASVTPGTNMTLYAKWNQTKYINGIQNNLKVTTTVGTKPTLPTTAMVRWSDNSTSSESVVWTEPDNYQSLYSAVGSFQVTGTVSGHSVKCTVNVVAASSNNATNGTNGNGATYSDVNQNQSNSIAKTGDETDYTPIAIAAGVGVVVVILAIALILKSRKK